MPTTRIIFRTARPIFQTRTPFFAQTQNAFSRSTARAGRRFQSTNAPAAEAATKSWVAQFWSSPVGPKTVHFWYVTQLGKIDGLPLPSTTIFCL